MSRTLKSNNVKQNLLMNSLEIFFKKDNNLNILISDEMKELSSHFQTKEKDIKERIKNLIPYPDARLWTRKSKRAISNTLRNINPDLENKIVINIGEQPLEIGYTYDKSPLLYDIPKVIK